MGGEWLDWIYKGLTILVIACPCALVISTPVTIVSGLATAARRGILIKGGVYLEKGRTLQSIAFDKTGTLTKGKPAVITFENAGAGLTDEEILDLATALAVRNDLRSVKPCPSIPLSRSRQDKKMFMAFMPLPDKA